MAFDPEVRMAAVFPEKVNRQCTRLPEVVVRLIGIGLEGGLAAR